MNKEIFIQIDSATQELIILLSSLNQEKLNKIPFEGSWTAGQLGDHLLKSYAVADALVGRAESTNRKPDEKVEKIREIFLDFSTKLKSPDFIIPSTGIIDKKELLSAVEKRQTQLQDISANKDLSETCLDFKLPGMGELTRLEWLHFMTAHTQRHVHQLKNIIKHLD